MFYTLLSRLFAFSSPRTMEEIELDRVSAYHLEQAAGRVVTADALWIWVGPAGRSYPFDPPLQVRILFDPERLAFDSVRDQFGETAVFYEAEVLNQERLPEGADGCFLDGPSYGTITVTFPDWWKQLSLE
jgi:hypothetical protein